MTTLLALAFVLNAGVGPALMTDGQEVLEGNLEVIIEDSDGGSRTLYFLITEDDRIPLRFVTAPRNLRREPGFGHAEITRPVGDSWSSALERVVPAG